MYKWPIEITYGQMKTQIDGDIIRAVQSYNINVDKDELVKALTYDRDQYDKGYADAMATIVRCKDCKYYATELDGRTVCTLQLLTMRGTDFCSYGVRKDGADNE